MSVGKTTLIWEENNARHLRNELKVGTFESPPVLILAHEHVMVLGIRLPLGQGKESEYLGTVS
jgi:hypothetical protein